MAKTIITSTEVQAARATGELYIPVDAIVTPLAWDMATDLGIKISCSAQQPAPAPGSCSLAAAKPEPQSCAAPVSADDEMISKVRSIVNSLLGTAVDATTSVPAASSEPEAKRSVVYAQMKDYTGEIFAHPGPPPGMEVTTVDAVDASHGSPMAAGYMTLTKGSFPWSFDYDEVQIVLEGELHLGGDAGNKVGRPGDIFYIPKGSNITFGTPNWTKFVYVTFPANWEG